MKANKRSAKSSGKKSVTPKKEGNISLTSILLEKHRKAETREGNKTDQTALLLQTILTGSDQQLIQILQEWVDVQQIEGIVRGWGSSHTNLFFNRIVSLLDDSPCRWAYPWLRQILRMDLTLNADNKQKMKAHMSQHSQAKMEELLKLQGKLNLFDSRS